MKHIKDIIPQTFNALLRKHQSKAIDTFYGKRLFRSRLEARWAVFFDAMNIKWDYEREGYELNGIRYLPDFWLPEVYLRQSGKTKGLWVEIKPTFEALEESKDKFRILDEPLVVFVGLPPGEGDSGHQYSKCDDGGMYWDNYMKFYKCKDCGGVKIEFDMGGHYYDCPHCGFGGISFSGIYQEQCAIEQALSARF